MSQEIFQLCTDAYTQLENCSSDVYEYTDVEDWRGALITFLTLSPFSAIDIKFEIPEKVLDTSNVQQSGMYVYYLLDYINLC